MTRKVKEIITRGEVTATRNGEEDGVQRKRRKIGVYMMGVGEWRAPEG